MTTFTTQDRQDAQRVRLTIDQIKCIEKWAHKEFKERAFLGDLPKEIDWPIFFARAIERAILNR
jgi:hypothetical protein